MKNERKSSTSFNSDNIIISPNKKKLNFFNKIYNDDILNYPNNPNENLLNHTYEKKSIKSSNQLSKIKSFYNDSFKKKPVRIKSFNKNKNSLIYANLTTKINENNIHINKISSFKKKISNYFLILRGYIYLLLGCFLSTIVNFLFQHATRNKIDSTIIVFYRGINLCIFTSFYIFYHFNSVKNEFDKNKIKTLMLRGLINCLGMCLVVTALNHIRINTLELLLRTGNIMSVFLGYYLINEIVTKWDIYSLLGTFLGVIFILKPRFIFGDIISLKSNGQEDQILGISLASITAFLIAYANVVTKTLMKHFNEIYIVQVMGIFSVFAGFIFSVLSGCDFLIGIYFFFYIFFVSFIEFIGVFYTFKSFKHESITKLSPFFNSRIVFSLILTYIIYGRIDKFDILGSLIIIVIYVYASYQKINSK